ncbi:glycerophosphodiester phosphodiesterase [uncultured Ilyobacter sp.]|uniref:glycerophosphodiester phosphodiesterase n=1 Tax=uncultured Ilyobacter sp. TaxID=544433 RepID=UPI0029C6F0F5|nr:glycerophosphodiester phosphodiesterase [uncultured Ilyobacter sp.]
MEIFGHRGASGYAPQNTMSAMRVALEQGTDGIELDVQLTKDNEVVVCHDWSIDNVSNGKGRVSDFTLNEIKKFDFGSYFSREFQGEKIPTLGEILDFLPKEMTLNIELKIKAENRGLLPEKVAELLMSHNRIENTIVSSFNHPCLKKIKNLIPKVKVAILYEGYLLNPGKYMVDLGMDIYSFHLNLDYINEKIIEDLHKHKKKVYIWTSNDTETTKKIFNMGADGVMTNFPIDMKNALSEYLGGEKRFKQ